MRAAVLQLSSQGMSSTKFYNYVRIAHKQGVKVLLLGEYILNPFFKELQDMTPSMIAEQERFQSKVLSELSKDYELSILAPLLSVKKGKIYKTISRFSGGKRFNYEQQILINYSHWNEERFFANEIKELKAPPVFSVDGFRFAILSGFELHFDELFILLKEKNIDCLLLPSVSTFDSYERWKNLILSRAFTNNFYILRANRIGEFKDQDTTWKFYGDSVLASPDGELLEHLGDKEELLIADMSHKEVVEARRFWEFKSTIKARK